MTRRRIQSGMANDEERWVAAAQRGERDAFRHLVETYARSLFALCVRITRDAALAEDAVQEALFNAYRHIRDFDGRLSLLVHNMGAELSDPVAQGAAGLSEFRTAPLWGVGQRVFFLHDGRATPQNGGLLAAIQAHASPGSEANT